MSSTVTLAQIARYATVRRPSVSTWRRRHGDFPRPVGGAPHQPLFDAEQMATWLDRRPAPNPGPSGKATTYGDIFRQNLYRSATLDGSGYDVDTFVRVGIALAALRAGHAQPLPADPVDLVAVTEAIEARYPGIADLLKDVGWQPEAAVPLAGDVERLIAQLDPAGACEEIITAAGARGWPGVQAQTPVEICELVLRIVEELTGDLDRLSVADLAAGPGRFLAAVASHGFPRTLRFAESDPTRAALLRLRLCCHGRRDLVRCSDGDATSEFTGSDVVFVDPPFQSGEQEHDDEHPLSWAARVVECLAPDGHRQSAAGRMDT
jgi:hypothetical protein